MTKSASAFRKTVNIIPTAIYSLASIAMFTITQSVAVLAPAWMAFTAIDYYVTEYKKMVNPPTQVSPFGILPRREPPPINLFILLIPAGAIMTYLVAVRSARALLRVGLGRGISGGYLVGTSGSKIESSLITVVTSVSTSVGVAGFKGIFLTTHIDFSTYYTMGGRYLVLSVLGLKYLTAEELRAIIAHECGHHHGGAMLLDRVHYRNTMLFAGLVSAFNEADEIARQRFAESEHFLSASLWGRIRDDFGVMALLSIVPLLLCLLIYRLFLSIMDFLIRDPEYEYYCDSVAVGLVGGETFSSALQKVVDLSLVERRLSRRGEEKINLLDELDREYRWIRATDPDERRWAATAETETHPPLYLRLARARSASGSPDTSKSIVSDLEFTDLWRRVATSDGYPKGDQAGRSANERS